MLNISSEVLSKHILAHQSKRLECTKTRYILRNMITDMEQAASCTGRESKYEVSPSILNQEPQLCNYMPSKTANLHVCINSLHLKLSYSGSKNYNLLQKVRRFLVMNKLQTPLPILYRQPNTISIP